jgi:hypothetical protein
VRQTVIQTLDQRRNGLGLVPGRLHGGNQLESLCHGLLSKMPGLSMMGAGATLKRQDSNFGQDQAR